MQRPMLFLAVLLILSTLSCATLKSERKAPSVTLDPGEIPMELEEALLPDSTPLLEDVELSVPAEVTAHYGELLKERPVFDYVDAGNEAYEKKDFRKAAAMFEEALRKMPDLELARYNLGMVYLKEKNYSKAIDVFERLAAKSNNSVLRHDSQVNLGLTYYRSGLSAQAITALTEGLPDSVGHYYLLAAYSDLNIYPQVISHGNDYLNLYGEESDVCSLIGLAHYHQGEFEQALDFLERAENLAPSDSQAQRNLGLIYMRLEQPQKAEAAFLRAQQLDPSFDPTEYIEFVQQAGLREAKRHYNKALRHAAEDDLDAAILEYEEAVQRDPAFVKAHINLGIAYGKQHTREKETAHLLRATQLDPTSFEAHYNLGIAYSKSKKNREAAEVLRRAVELNPESAKAQYNLGITLHRAANTEQALEPFRKAIKLRPRWDSPRMNLALALGHLGQLAEAIQELEVLVRIYPQNSDNHYNLAVLYYQNRQREEATEACENAVRTNPMNIRAQKMLDELTAQ